MSSTARGPRRARSSPGLSKRSLAFIRKRGVVVLISDFLESPEQVLRAVRELQF